jgi:uncharacterized protein YkwD
MKSLLGGEALRRTLLAVLIAAVGALIFPTRSVDPGPKSQAMIAKAQAVTTTSTDDARPSFKSPAFVTVVIVDIPAVTATTRDWRSVGGLVVAEDPDALLAHADSQLHQLQGPINPADDGESTLTGTPSESASESTDVPTPAPPLDVPPATDAPPSATAPPTTTTPSDPPSTTTTTVPPPATTTTAPAGGYVSGGDESTFLSLINGTRSSAGVAAVSRDGGLDGYARWWAEQMAIAGGISHSGMGGIDGKWSISAENVGAGGTAQALYGVFTGSSGHLANITDGRYTHVGVGAWIDGTGILWTVHIFAAR